MAEKKIMVMIPEGIAIYPHILEEDKYQLKEHGKREFNTQVKLEPESNEEHATFLANIDAECEKAFADGKLELEAKVKDPAVKGKAKKSAKDALENLKIHKPYQPEYDDEAEETGAFIVATKCLAGGTYAKGPKTGQDWSKSLPLFDSTGEKIKFPTKIDENGNKTENRSGMSVWGGSRLVVSAEVIPFCAEGLELAGVSLRMQAVQIIEAKGGDGGDAESFGFGVVEGGYKADNFSTAASGEEAGNGSTAAAGSEEDDF